VIQILHRTEVYITRGAAGKKGKAIVGQMSDERALELAATFVSEGFVFSVTFSILCRHIGLYKGRSRDSSVGIQPKQEV